MNANTNTYTKYMTEARNISNLANSLPENKSKDYYGAAPLITSLFGGKKDKSTSKTRTGERSAADWANEETAKQNDHTRAVELEKLRHRQDLSKGRSAVRGAKDVISHAHTAAPEGRTPSRIEYNGAIVSYADHRVGKQHKEKAAPAVVTPPTGAEAPAAKGKSRTTKTAASSNVPMPDSEIKPIRSRGTKSVS